MASDPDDKLINAFRLKRVQRGVEYVLLATVHLFFVISFRGHFQWWMAVALFLVTFSLNFQLTQLREWRRTTEPGDRRQIVADTFESLLFLAFVLALSFVESITSWLEMTAQEYLAYVAALLGGVFIAALIGEIYWQSRHLGAIGDERRRNYVRNLRRTVILPYLRVRRR